MPGAAPRSRWTRRSGAKWSTADTTKWTLPEDHFVDYGFAHGDRPRGASCSLVSSRAPSRCGRCSARARSTTTSRCTGADWVSAFAAVQRAPRPRLRRLVPGDRRARADRRVDRRPPPDARRPGRLARRGGPARSSSTSPTATRLRARRACCRSRRSASTCSSPSSCWSSSTRRTADVPDRRRRPRRACSASTSTARRASATTATSSRWRVMGHSKKVLLAVGGFELPLEKFKRVDPKLMALARDQGSGHGRLRVLHRHRLARQCRATGITDEQLLALPRHREATCFSELERAGDRLRRRQ